LQFFARHVGEDVEQRISGPYSRSDFSTSPFDSPSGLGYADFLTGLASGYSGSLTPLTGARSKPVQIRFTADTIRRAKALAAERNTGYQTLIKEFVTERLYEEEKRAGLR